MHFRVAKQRQCGTVLHKVPGIHPAGLAMQGLPKRGLVSMKCQLHVAVMPQMLMRSRAWQAVFPWKAGLHHTVGGWGLFNNVFSLPIYLLSILVSVHLTFRKHLCCLLLTTGKLPPAAPCCIYLLLWSYNVCSNKCIRLKWK